MEKRKEVSKLIQAKRREAVRLLSNLIRFPSTLGKERKVQLFLKGEFKKIGLETRLIPVKEGLRKDSYFTSQEERINYRDRPNLVALWKGASGGRSIIFNTHCDVVSGGDWKEAFKPRVKGEFVFGRGACDAKGQMVAAYIAISALKELGIRLRGDVIMESAIEEEIGGNGTLALIRQGFKAQGAIVFEPTQLNIHPAARGGLWFRVTVEGKPVQMGRIKEGVNAIEKMIKVIRIFKEYEKRMVEESRGHPLFQDYDHPTPLNIGILHGGEWPSTVAGRAVMEGGVGFLPGKSMERVKEELKEAILNSADEWLKSHFLLEFPRMKNDAHEIPSDHPLPQTLKRATQEAGLSSKVNGCIFSSDSRLFQKPGEMPVVVFGPGDIACAHSAEERISIPEMLKGAEVLAYFLMDWCGEV